MRISGRRSDLYLDDAESAGRPVADLFHYRVRCAVGLPDRYEWRRFRQSRIASPGQTGEIARRGGRARCLDKT